MAKLERDISSVKSRKKALSYYYYIMPAVIAGGSENPFRVRSEVEKLVKSIWNM